MEGFVMFGCGFLTAVTISFILYYHPSTAKWMACCVTNIIVGSLLSTFTIFAVDINSVWWPYTFSASILFIFALLPPCWNFSLILSSALWGTFAIAQAIMLLWETYASYMIVNMMSSVRLSSKDHQQNREVVQQFSIEGMKGIMFKIKNKIMLYFIYIDFVLLVVWMVMLVVAVWVQRKKWKNNENEVLVNRQTGRSISINIRTPLISRWTRGSDDVFESPETNSRLMASIRKIQQC